MFILDKVVIYLEHIYGTLTKDMHHTWQSSPLLIFAPCTHTHTNNALLDTFGKFRVANTPTDIFLGTEKKPEILEKTQEQRIKHKHDPTGELGAV